MAGRAQQSRLSQLILVLIVNAAALWAAAAILSGFDIDGIGSLLGMAFLFAVVNATLKPAAYLVGFPLTVLSLGLIALVINGALLLFTAWVGSELIGLDVDLGNFLDAVLAALIVSVVSWLLNTFVGRPVRWTTS
jgi:putative membrane protein